MIRPAGMSCPGDRLVWVNTPSGVYYFKGQRYFGCTKTGKFQCESDAVRERAKVASFHHSFGICKAAANITKKAASHLERKARNKARQRSAVSNRAVTQGDVMPSVAECTKAALGGNASAGD
jgi:hypothetical protein